MRYLAVLGRQPKISMAELEALFGAVRPMGVNLAEFEANKLPDIKRLGGTQKIAIKINDSIPGFLEKMPKDGKITLGVSDYTPHASAFKAQGEALKLKRLLVKGGRSVRVVPNKEAVLSSATSYHNKLWSERKLEMIKFQKDFYRVVAVQNIDAYARRDQGRPARDAKVGMLPPKLAQILINLCGELTKGSRVLDPFCGTGVVLQEAALMGYTPYGTDLSERMVEYSRKNLEWLERRGANSLAEGRLGKIATLEVGNATDFQWEEPIDAVACETYLGPPMSLPPAEIKLKEAKQECKGIILGFLKNLAGQIKSGTPVVIAVPAWLRPNGEYERLNFLDEIENLSYNVRSFKNLGQRDLLYHREKQIVAREIIVLRKR